MPDDCFSIDLLTPEPFLALENCGLAVRGRQNAKPNIYDFPTVCAWYVQEKTKGAMINNTAGLVGEMDEVVKTGFLKYSPMALRLVPDSYGDITEQGWWDEERMGLWLSGQGGLVRRHHCRHHLYQIPPGKRVELAG